MTTLETPRLLLRRVRPEDVDDLHAVLSNDAAMTYWSTGPHSTTKDTRVWIASMMAGAPVKGDDFVIEFEGSVIGKMGAWRLPDFGFILAPEYWGRGFASEALAAFLPHVFARPDVDRLTADVDPRNLASLKLLDRFGFIRIGYGRNTWQTHIGACDSVYLELTAERARNIGVI